MWGIRHCEGTPEAIQSATGLFDVNRFAIRLTFKDNLRIMIRVAQQQITKENFLRGLAILGVVVLLWLTLNVLFALGSQDELKGQASQAALFQNKKPQIQHDALFGAYDRKNGPLQETGLNLQLTGVFATQNPFDGSAVISMSGRKSQLFTVGDKIGSGVVIKEIHSDYVVLEEAGQRSVLRLPKKTL